MQNSYVTFAADGFNTSEPKDYYINSNCYGDDVGKWLLEEFQKQKILYEKDGPDQEDFGWYVNFSVNNKKFTCLIIYSEGEGLWKLVLEKNAGLFGTILGQRNKKVSSTAVDIIDKILKANPDIREIEWHNVSIT